MQLQHTTSQTTNMSRTVAELGVCGGRLGDQGAGNSEGGSGLGQQFHKVGG